jgi:hypothetical protein
MAQSTRCSTEIVTVSTKLLFSLVYSSLCVKLIPVLIAAIDSDDNRCGGDTIINTLQTLLGDSDKNSAEMNLLKHQLMTIVRRLLVVISSASDAPMVEIKYY